MRPVTLRSGLVLVVVAALVPIGTLSVLQALSTLRYSRTLVGNQLVTSALVTAGHERDPLIIGEQVLLTLSENNAVHAGGEVCNDALRMGLGNNPALLNLSRSDASGRVQCSVLPFDPAISLAGESWWQRGIRSREFTVGAMEIGPISQKRAIIGMLPTVAADGTIDGALTVTIDASWLEASLAPSQVPRDAAVAVVDGAGTVVLTSEPRELPRFDVNAGNERVAHATSSNGTSWMYAVAPLYGRELYVAYAEPTEQLMATAVRQVRIDLLLPIFALFIASLAIWMGTTRLVLRWLDALRTLAAQFTKGNFVGDPARFARAPLEISLLSADLHSMAQVIAARDNDLQAALDAKTALTHEIHHRVKNNLQIISSLLSLQANKISDPAAREAIGQTRARIGALAQIHRLLFEDSHDSDHGMVNIASLLSALCSQLRALHRGQSAIQLLCDVASQTVPINSAVPLTLLAVEAVTNAYRHGFQPGQSGMIFVHFGVENDLATLSVSDDGVGFDPAGMAGSMGRELMDAFAQQLGGTLKIASAPETGTVVTLTYALIQEHQPAAIMDGA